ncbi:13365_t:CDS:2, partial [Entrophospora sp. SA101]
MHRKELSVAQREQIIGAYISGVKQKVISAQLDIPTSTINDTIKQYKETGFATPEKCPSCPKLLTQFRKYLHDEGLVRVWRKPGEAYKEDCIQPTVKFGGGTVMFWECFGWHGVRPLIVVEGNMDSNDYINILAGHFIPWVNNYPNSIFQQDKAPCHTSNCRINKCNTREMGKISIETLHHLILSLPDCVKAVIKAK